LRCDADSRNLDCVNATTTATAGPTGARWPKIERDLGAVGFTVREAYFRSQQADPSSYTPYGLLVLADMTGMDLRDFKITLESLLAAQQMAVIDIGSPDDQDSSGELFVWLHEREKLRFLPPPAARSSFPVSRLTAAAKRLTAKTPASVETTGPFDTENGWQSRVTLRETGRAHETDAAAKRIVLMLGSWGWAASGLGLLRSRRKLSPDQLDDIVVRTARTWTGRHWPLVLQVTESRRPHEGDLEWSRAFGAVGGWETAVMAAAVASAVVPFVQAFASKAGEDTYQALRNLIRRHAEPDTRTRLYDPDADIYLVFDAPLPDEAIRQLARLKPAQLKGRPAEWDAEAKTWRLSRKNSRLPL
jgi:hypothetical protein